MNMVIVVLVSIGVVLSLVLSYRIGYTRGYAAKERMIWDEDTKSIEEYKTTSRPARGRQRVYFDTQRGICWAPHIEYTIDSV